MYDEFEVLMQLVDDEDGTDDEMHDLHELHDEEGELQI